MVGVCVAGCVFGKGACMAGGLHGKGSIHCRGVCVGGGAWQEGQPVQRTVRVLLEWIIVEE